jgi:hypothetical protein
MKIATSLITGAAALAISLSGAGVAQAAPIHLAGCAQSYQGTDQPSAHHKGAGKAKSHAKHAPRHARHRAEGGAVEGTDVIRRHDPHVRPDRLARDGELARGMHERHHGGQCGSGNRGGAQPSGFRHDRHRAEGKARHERHELEGKGRHLEHRLEHGRI